MKLRHNDDAGTSAPGALRFRRQRRGEGGLERFVRAGRAEGSRKWPTSSSSSNGVEKKAGKFHEFLETEIEFGLKLRPNLIFGLS